MSQIPKPESHSLRYHRQGDNIRIFTEGPGSRVDTYADNDPVEDIPRACGFGFGPDQPGRGFIAVLFTLQPQNAIPPGELDIIRRVKNPPPCGIVRCGDIAMGARNLLRRDKHTLIGPVHNGRTTAQEQAANRHAANSYYPVQVQSIGPYFNCLFSSTHTTCAQRD